MLSIPAPDFHHEHGDKATVKVKIEGQNWKLDLDIVPKSDFFFSPCNDSAPGFLTPSSSVLCCAAVSTCLCIPCLQQSLNPSPPLSHCPVWLACWHTDTAELLLHSSSLCLASSPSPPWTPQLTPYLSAMQPAASNKPGECLTGAPSPLHLSV